MSSSRHSLAVAVGLLVACFAGPVFGQAPAPASPFAVALKRGFELISEGKFSKARKELEAAQALKGGPCGECLLGLSHVYAADKQWKRAEEAARQATALLKTPHALARAYHQLGMSLARSRGGVADAEEALRQAAALGGPWGDLARYNLADLLLKAERWAEAAEAARGYLKVAGPQGTALRQARIALCQARSRLQDDLPPQETQAPQGPLQVGGEVKRPEILYQASLPSTGNAQFARVRGSVIVQTRIDREGCVGDVKVLKALRGDVSDAAASMLRRWVFAPATLEGQPVEVYFVLTVNLG